MKTSQAIAQMLKKEGVEYLFAYPVNHLIEGAAEEGIRTIIVRQERIGIHMADAISKLSSGDTIGVFAMQHGPGSENAYGGVAQSYGDAVPVVIFPAGHTRANTNVKPNFSSLVNFQGITKSLEQVTLAKEAAHAVRRAFSNARNGRPGPCMVELPLDVLTEEYPADAPSYTPTKRFLSAPDPAAVEEVAEMLVNAKNPVLYAGQGVHYAKAWPELQALAELLEAPVTTSIEGKSAFDEAHPLSLQSGGRAMSKQVHVFLENADLIFGIGASFTYTNYGIDWQKYARGKAILQNTIDTQDLNKQVVIDHALVGDSKLMLQALLVALKKHITSPRGRRTKIEADIARLHKEWMADWLPLLTSNQTPINPYRVLHDLSNTVDRNNTIITHDAGSPRDQITPFWQCSKPLSYLGWGKTTQLGYGLGLAMGAKLAQPDKLCINWWGDAAIGFTGMDFETAVRERLPILSVLSNNFCMAIELEVMPVSTRKYNATDISGHYADFAKALGGYGERIEDPDEIVPAIKRGIEQTKKGKPALLEFITSKEERLSRW